MKKLLVVLLFIGLFASASAQPPSCERHFFQKTAPEITRKSLQASTVGLCFEAFAVLHSGVSRTPLWSAEHLTRDSLKAAREIPRADSFHAEPALPPGQGAELADYVRSGFDRGHMAPAADMPTEQAQHESFSLANIVPQNRKNNQILWAAIEGATRHLTNLRGELYVITGPVFEGDKLERINGRVLVPTHVFKAVLDPAKQEAAAWLAPNNDSGEFQVINVDTLERRIGINLFPKLTDTAKQRVMELPEPRIRGRK
ncbi:MAG: DNA/RNA non-specific endonuclease [Burkholderiaceae bacterium]